MSTNGRAINLNDLKEEGDPIQVVQKVSIQAFDADATWLSKNMTVDEQLHNGAFVGPDDRGISSLEVASESTYEPFGSGSGSGYSDSYYSSDAEDNQITSSLVAGDNVSGQQLVVGSIHEADYTDSLKNSSNLEICKDSSISPSRRPRRGLGHCITAPVGTYRNHFLESHGIAISRSMTEKRDAPRHELKLDRLSNREKKKLIVELVRIQNDGTVEVDLTKSAPVASELLEFHSVERVPSVDYVASDSNKSVPRLKIAVLVVGTRGDVQPFLAVSKRLQEFGHHVRLATHANFRTFVESAGVNFYPLGGDPRVLAGYMARNKGFIPSAPGEISVQRKQLKSIIQSLLPACTEPDTKSGEPFIAQAIIANPPAYVLLFLFLFQILMSKLYPKILRCLLWFMVRKSARGVRLEARLIAMRSKAEARPAPQEEFQKLTPQTVHAHASGRSASRRKEALASVRREQTLK